MAMGHYRIYELDSADHIVNDYSVVCRSDAAAMAVACKITESAAESKCGRAHVASLT